MDKKKRNIIILVFLCVLLIVIGIIIFINLSFDNDIDNLIINDKDDSVISGEIKNDEFDEYDDVSNINDNTYVDDDIINKTKNDDFYSEINNNEQVIYNEQDVVSYFEDMEYEVENSASFKEKFKEYFITIVDFIFYDGEIKGYTFDELTGTAKAKIIAVALKIDSKIEEYVPNYKESISNKTGKIYTNVKEKLVTSYMDISSAICKDNKEGCNKVKEIFSDVKDYCKIGWDFIKGLFKSGVIKLKDWYEIYSGK